MPGADKVETQFSNIRKRNKRAMDVTCDICTARIVYPVYFLLKPCSHTACVKCFHEMVPAKVFLRCPCSGCRESVTSSTLLEITSTECNNSRISLKLSSSNQPPSLDSTSVTTSDSDADASNSNSYNNSPKAEKLHSLEYIRAIQEVPHFEPDEQMDPFRHWAIKKPEIYTGFMYVAYRFSNHEATFYKSNFKAVDSSVFMDDNSSDEMVKIFARILHPLLFRRDFSSSMKEGTSLSAKQSSGSYIIPPAISNLQNRQYLAMRCMYALSSGCVLTRKEQEEILGGSTDDNSDRDEGMDGSAKILAKELMVAYKKSCCVSPESTTSSSSLDNTKETSPLPANLQPQMELSTHSKREAIESLRRLNEGMKDDKSHDNNGRWVKELGLCDNYNIDSGVDDKSSPIIPVILWILSAAFILSK